MSLLSEEGGVRLPRPLTLGCELSCTTVRGDILRGNLMAVDEKARLVVIKETPSELSTVIGEDRNVHIINLENATKLEVLSEPLTPPSSHTHLQQVDFEKLLRRRDVNIEAKLKEVRSRGVNVSEQAQQLYDYISKMYSDMEWHKDVIVVLKDVRISPPYGPENCQGSQSACERIKKQVAKFHKETSTD